MATLQTDDASTSGKNGDAHQKQPGATSSKRSSANQDEGSTALEEALKQTEELQEKQSKYIRHIGELEMKNRAQKEELQRKQDELKRKEALLLRKDGELRKKAEELVELHVQLQVSSPPSSPTSTGNLQKSPTSQVQVEQPLEEHGAPAKEQALILQLQRAIDIKDDELEEHKSQLEAKDRVILTLEKEIHGGRRGKKAPERVTTYEEQVALLTQMLSRYEESDKQQKQEIAQLQTKLHHAEDVDEQIIILTANVSTLEQEKEDLQKELGELKQTAAVIPQLEAGTRDHAYLQKLREEIDRLRPLKERVHSLEQQLEAREKRHRERKAKNQTLQQKLEALEREHKESSVEVEVPEEVHELQASLKEKEEEIHALQEKLSSLEKASSELSKMQLHAKEQSRKMLELKQKLQAFEVGKEEEQTSTNETLYNLQDEIQRLTDEQQAVRRDKQSLQEELNSTRAKNEELVAEVQQLERESRKLRDNIKKLSQLSVQDAQMQKILDEKQVLLSALQKEKEDIYEELQAAKAEALVYKADFEAEREDRAQAFGKMDDLRTEHVKTTELMRSDLQMVEVELEHHKQLLLEAKQQKTEKELKQESQKREKELKQQLQDARKEIEKREKEFKQQLKDAKQESQEQEKEFKHEVEEARQEVQAKTSQVKQYKKQVDTLKDQNAQLEKHNSNWVEAMKQVRRELEKTRKEPKKSKKKTTEIAGASKAALEKRVVELEGLSEGLRSESDALHEENDCLLEEVAALQRTGSDLRKLLRDSMGTPPELPPKPKKGTDSMSPSVSPMTSPIDSQGRQLDAHITSTLESNVTPLSEQMQAFHIKEQEEIRHQLQQQFQTEKAHQQQALQMQQANPQLPHPAMPKARVFEDSGHLTTGTGRFAAQQSGGVPGVPPYTPAVEPPQSTVGPPQGSRLAPPTQGDPDSKHQPASRSQQFQHPADPQATRRNRAESYPQQATPGQMFPMQPQMGYQLQGSVTIPPDHVSLGVREEISEPQSPVSDPHALAAATLQSSQSGQPFRSDHENTLMNSIQSEIYNEAKHVVSTVREDSSHRVTQKHIPYDPNLVCPYCTKQFRIGEIQYFKRHVGSCTGSDPVV